MELTGEGMNLEAVRTFVAVAEEGQFRHAAARLGISQQAASKRVAALEAVLGVALFARVPTGAELTVDGRAFLPHARAVLAAVRRAVESVRHQGRPLRVDVLRNLLASTEVLRDFHRAHPDVPLEVVTLDGAESAVRALLDGEVDAAFVYLRRPAAEWDGRLASALVCLEELEVVVGERHPLAGARPLALADLAPYVVWMPGLPESREWGAFYRELARDFALAVDTSGPDFGVDALLDGVDGSGGDDGFGGFGGSGGSDGAGARLTFVGDRTRVVWRNHQRLHRIPLAPPAPVYPWSLVWHTGNPHPELPRLIRYAREAGRAQVRELAAGVGVGRGPWLPTAADVPQALGRPRRP
ncbi:LysR family transcriptional regulator [Streptomyces sp. NPDC020412]|uniref:LysR family transcriptional regulator n=1 Tax=Streptomyces sp. NPDC020412 TaxID=3365073 RepID=UPI003790D106